MKETSKVRMTMTLLVPTLSSIYTCGSQCIRPLETAASGTSVKSKRRLHLQVYADIDLLPMYGMEDASA